VALIGDAAKASQDKMRALLVFAMQGTFFFSRLCPGS